MAKIETSEQYDWAVGRVETLLPLVGETTSLNDRRSIELVLLSNLVADYSDEHYNIGTPTLSGVLKLRMYEMGLTQKSLAALLGVSPSRVSQYLTGKSKPSLRVAQDMHSKLNVDANILLGCSR